MSISYTTHWPGIFPIPLPLGKQIITGNGTEFTQLFYFQSFTFLVGLSECHSIMFILSILTHLAGFPQRSTILTKQHVVFVYFQPLWQSSDILKYSFSSMLYGRIEIPG